MFPVGTASVAAPGLTINGDNSFANISGPGQGSAIQYQQPSLFPSTGNQSIIQQFTPVTGHPSVQPWSSSPAQGMQGYLSSSTAQGSQPVPKSTNEVTSDVESQTAVVDVKLSGRKEFPAAPTPTFQQSVKSPNPFDVFSGSSTNCALPNALPQSSLMRTSCLGSSSLYNPALPPQGPSYALALPPQALTYASAMPPRTYMGQQVLGNVPPSGHQGFGSIGAEEAAFGYLSVDQQFAGRFSATTSPSSFSSVGGNPFG